MKAVCEIQAYLLSLSNCSTTDSDIKALYSCSGKCTSSCCAILMLRYIVQCNDVASLVADALVLLQKYQD